jgi:integrase
MSTPKTSTSQAVLPMPDALAGIVREHIAMLRSEWLFPNTRGGFLTSENVVKQVLSPILKKLCLPRCGFHAFRHTHATLLLYSGATPQEAQAQLRHADPRITIGVYSHVQAESRRAVVEKVASVLDLDGPNQQTMSQTNQ